MQIDRGKCMSAILFFLIMGIWAPASSAAAKDPEKVAVVNGTVITRDMFDREMEQVRQRISRSGGSTDSAQLSSLKAKVLESVIGAELLYQEGRSRGIRIDEERIQEQWEAVKSQFPDEKGFKEALIRMNASEALVKSQIERGLTIQDFIRQEIVQGITVTEKETKDYYDNNPDKFTQPEQVKASHILIKVDPEADETGKRESRKKIEKVRKRLEKGEDFAELAREVSQGPTSVKGGDLGYFSRGDVVKPFAEAAFSLNPGEVSDVVETRFGYHLIKVTDRREETKIQYPEIKDRLQGAIKQVKVDEALGEYIHKLRDKADVEIFLEENP